MDRDAVIAGGGADALNAELGDEDTGNALPFGTAAEPAPTDHVDGTRRHRPSTMEGSR